MNKSQPIQTQQKLQSSRAHSNSKHQKRRSSQKYFRIGTLIVFVIILAGTTKFIMLKQWRTLPFSAQSLIWIPIGFLFYCLIKDGLRFMTLEYIGKHFMRDPPCGLEQLPGDRQDRLNMFFRQMFDVLLHGVLTIICFASFKDENWFPSLLGGNVGCNHILDGYPNWQIASLFKLQMVMMVQFGFCIYTIYQVAWRYRHIYINRQKYWEMLLHHVTTFALFLFANLSNIAPVGILILFVHDASDFLRALDQFSSDIKNWYIWKTMLLSINVIKLIGWVYFRIIVFPLCINQSIYDALPWNESFSVFVPLLFIVFLNFMIFSMHVFWLYLMVRVGRKRWQEIKFHQKYLKQKDNNRQQLKKQ